MELKNAFLNKVHMLIMNVVMWWRKMENHIPLIGDHHPAICIYPGENPGP